MNRIEHVFTQQKTLLNIFVTAGYPQINSLPKLAKQLVNQGVDIIEVGLPYSDPLADGEVIQQASAVALANGITLAKIFKQVTEIRTTSDTIPIILMGYFNQLLQVGVDTFLARCRQHGVDGVIIPDLPVEVYRANYKHIFDYYQIKISFLITPQTSTKRIVLLDKECTSFLYIVSDNSLTGEKKGEFAETQISYFKRINTLHLTSPIMIGFGISTKKMVLQANKYAHGAIIGSAYLKAVKLNKESSFIDKLI